MGTLPSQANVQTVRYRWKGVFLRGAPARQVAPRAHALSPVMSHVYAPEWMRMRSIVVQHVIQFAYSGIFLL